MKIKAILSLFVGLIVCPALFADSPLTSTDISKAYKNSMIVQQASKAKGKLNEELLEYLSDSDNPLELRIAVINELGWDFDGKNNSTLFRYYLKSKGLNEMTDASADILICYAYLKAMDDYFDVDEAIIYAQKAKSKNEKSYTINIICALIEAQKALDTNWCAVYQLLNDVRKNSRLNNDMRPDAANIIFEYTDLYAKHCR